MLSSIVSCTSQEKEIPITSSSKEAIKIFKEGRFISENFEFDKAIEKYDEALKLDPDFALAYLYKAIDVDVYNERISNIEKAVNLVDKVSEGEKALILLYKAFYESNEGVMWTKLDRLLELYPKDKRVNLLAGGLNYNWQRYDEAIPYYEKVLEIDDQFPPVFNLMGYVNMRLEQFDESEKYFKKYIEILPNNANPYDSYADFLLSQDRYDESIKYYKMALDKDETFNVSLRRIGNIHILKEDYEKARDAFKKYYDVSSTLGSKFIALINIANTYLYEGNKEKALNTFEDYKKLAQKNESPYNEVLANSFQGYIYACCENPDKGLEYYDQALKIIENSELIEAEKNELRLRASILRSHAFIEFNDFDKSKEELNKCKNLAAKLENTFFNAWVDLTLAYNEIGQNNVEQALNILESITVDNPLKNYYLGLAYEKEGDMENAKKYFSEILNSKESSMNLAMYYKRVKEKLQK